MEVSKKDYQLTGTVSNFPRRRAVHPRLLFLEVSVGQEQSAPAQILLKHGQGGSYSNGEELEKLRQNVRHGDTIRLEIGKSETLDNGDVLLHATNAQILVMNIHGNTGSSYQKTLDLEDLKEITATEDPENCETDDHSFCEDHPQEVHLPSKKERFAVFAAFITTTFPAGTEVYDIAGGHGELALLLTLAGFNVTLVDPRENAGMLSSRKRKQLRKSGKEPFKTLRLFFDSEGTIVNKTTTRKPILIGLHPDEATEAIVDAAILHRCPFAVAPCCVFSRVFPSRRYQGRPVRTHEQLCRYLQSKAPGIQRTLLSFGGRATVLYHLGDYGET